MESALGGGVVSGRGGRVLAYDQVGDPAGAPIICLHGTPGSRLSGRHPRPERVVAAGLRLITYDRPGYGRSDRQAGRRVVDCAADVATLADHLELERFAVNGGSGGGPHALAVGARLPERVTRVGCDVGVAPFDASDLDWLAGMDPVNVRETNWALAGEQTLTKELEQEARRALERVDRDPTALFQTIELSASDRAVLADSGVREVLRAAVREMFAQGVSGWVDDDLALISPWGFEVEELTVPVDISYGREDVLVPSSHGEWLARHIPHASVTIAEDAGHLSLPDHRLERLGALLRP